MRAGVSPCAALGAVAALVAAPAAAQVRWSKDAGNPVLVRSGTFVEALAVGQPTLLLEDTVLRLWYAAGGLDRRGRIVAARSTDGGRTWEREAGGAPALDVGGEGAWDGFFLDTPEVVRDGGLWRLYYFGATSNDPVGGAIGLALSHDGVRFERVGTGPVLEPGPPGSWDELWVESPAVVRAPGGGWLMLYTGVDATWRVRIGLATSPDGVRWSKHPANPVVNVGTPGSWDDGGVGVPGVIAWRGGYLMVYAGVGAADLADGTPDEIGVGLAASRDGVRWRRFGESPVLATRSAPYRPDVDDRGPWAPDIVWDPARGRFVMLYETAAGLCRATAPAELARRPAGRAVPRRPVRPPAGTGEVNGGPPTAAGPPPPPR